MNHRALGLDPELVRPLERGFDGLTVLQRAAALRRAASAVDDGVGTLRSVLQTESRRAVAALAQIDALMSTQREVVAELSDAILSSSQVEAEAHATVHAIRQVEAARSAATGAPQGAPPRSDRDGDRFVAPEPAPVAASRAPGFVAAAVWPALWDRVATEEPAFSELFRGAVRALDRAEAALALVGAGSRQTQQEEVRARSADTRETEQ